MRTASSCFRPKRSACWRKSDDVSTRTVRPACSMITETLRRLSRGSSERQVSQSQPIEGTPVEVPVPRKVSFIERRSSWCFELDALNFELSAVKSELCALNFVLCSFKFVFQIQYQPQSTKFKVQSSNQVAYFPPVISFPENALGFGVALANDTYCMRKSDNRPSIICTS